MIPSSPAESAALQVFVEPSDHPLNGVDQVLALG